MSLAEKLFLLRTKKNMTQSKLASEMGVSRQSVSKWELGEAVPEMKNIQKLSKIFDVNIEYLLNDSAKTDDTVLTVDSAEKEKKKAKKINRTYLSVLIASIGLFIIVVISIMSAIFPSYVEIEKTYNEEQISFVNSSECFETENENYTEIIESKGFLSFVKTYNLQILCIIAVFMMSSGLIGFIKIKKRRCDEQ